MTIKIISSTAFDGPSIWHQQPVSVLTVDFGPDGHRQSANDGVHERIVESIESLSRCSPPMALDPLPIDAGENLPALFGKLALNMQRLAGDDVNFVVAQAAAEAGHNLIVVQNRHAKLGLAAANLAARLINHHLYGTEPALDLEKAFRTTFLWTAESLNGTSTGRSMLNAARQRGIPISSVDPRGRIIELGSGVYRRRLMASATSRSSTIASTIARDKHLTKHYLREAGLPVPDGELVRTIEQAVAAADAIGYPVVIKPADLGASVGVFVDIRNEEQLQECFAASAGISESGKIIVERFIAGKGYRFLVVDGQLVAGLHRIPAHVVGDGTHTIRQLVDRANADPRRGPGKDHPLRPIVLDEVALDMMERLGYTIDGIPRPGLKVQLQPIENHRTGGELVDCTVAIHPDNDAIIRQAVQVVGLDIAGIDVVARDIAESIWETDGAILEVNDGIGFNPHLFPSEGQPRDPGPAIIDMLFPPGSPVRVPIVAVTGTGDRTSLVHQFAGIMTAAGYSVGLAAADGLFVKGTHLRNIDPAEPAAARKILNNPAVDFAVIEVDPLEMLEHGLCFDYCDVAVVLAASDQAPSGFPPLETVLCRTVDADGTVVLDAGDPRLPELQLGVRGRVVLVDGLERIREDAIVEPWLENVGPAFR